MYTREMKYQLYSIRDSISEKFPSDSVFLNGPVMENQLQKLKRSLIVLVVSSFYRISIHKNILTTRTKVTEVDFVGLPTINTPRSADKGGAGVTMNYENENRCKSLEISPHHG